MSGMDRLSDADVEWHAAHGAPLSAAMARELLAHRRASQAAPTPSDHLVSVGKASGMVEARVSLAARQIRQTLRDYGHRCAETSLPDLIAADVDAALRKQDEIHALAPSDGLREAWIAGRDAAAAEAFYACGCKDSIEALTPPAAYSRAALTPAPAQEVKP